MFSFNDNYQLKTIAHLNFSQNMEKYVLFREKAIKKAREKAEYMKDDSTHMTVKVR